MRSNRLLCSLGLKHKTHMSGDHSGGVPPVPIPNTEVKPSCADGTALWWGGRVGRCQAFFVL